MLFLFCFFFLVLLLFLFENIWDDKLLFWAFFFYPFMSGLAC